VRGAGTPLAVAIRSGHADIADDLRSLGAPAPEVEAVDALLGAILAGDGATVRATDGAVVEDARRRHPGFAAWAATRGIPAVAAALVAGFDVDGLGRSDAPIDQPWQTALHAAVERDDVDLVEWLLAHGANTAIRDARFGSTPLDWARHLGRPRCASLLAPDEQADG
jgi:ankyrin repeat protein